MTDVRTSTRLRALLAGDRPVTRGLLALVVMLTLTAIGTGGYMLVERVAWFDALYMTVITLSTVGFGEVIPLTRLGRLFTMGLIVVGVGTAAYFVTSMAHLLAVDVLSKLATVNSMQTRIDRLSHHVIVCGFGSLGRTVADELTRGKIPIVIIERDLARQPELEKSKHAFLIGNATSDEVLLSAGLDRARALVAGTGSDPDNVFITLAARERRPQLMIHARGETSESVSRLKQAGANYVLSPLQMGGLSLAATISRPSVAQFLQIAHPRAGVAVDLEEVRVMNGARLIGRTMAEVEAELQRLRIVTMIRGERTDLIPESSLRIEAGDYLVVIGDRKALEQLANSASKPAAQADT